MEDAPMRRMMIGVLALSWVALTGCGSSDTAPTAAKGDAAATKVAGGDTPTDAIQTFLEAIRTGDDKSADLMLTAIARVKTKEADLHVAPPGSKTAKFSVGRHNVNGKEAHVESTWTDMDEEGKPQTDEIVWILRKEPEGWRISGMATELFPGEDPLVLNFENPEEMLKKQQQAEQEMIKRASATLTNGGQPQKQPGAKTANKPAPAQPGTK
jgi:hypothetical protein